MIKTNERILIMAAHPDDEVLGCGGTIAKYAKDNEIYVAILGEGISSRYSQKGKGVKKAILELQKESKKAGKILGVKKNFFFNLPDNQFDTVPFLEIVKKVEGIIKRVKPAKIYTQHPGDLNIDHQLTFRAVLTAARPLKDCPVKEIYSFEILSSTEWSFQKINKPFSPNIFEDISETIDKKINAMKIYKTEIKKFPHPRSEEAILSAAKRWGSVAGLKCAEAFELIRWIR